MSGLRDPGYGPAKSPIRTDAVTYEAVKLAAERRELPTTLRAVVREAVRSRFPDEFAEAGRMVAAEVAARPAKS